MTDTPLAPGAPVWDPDVLGRVRHLALEARMLTDALMAGTHRSRRVGQAIEFADYQEYVPGMDLRGLDWKVLGRTDRLVIRRYEHETELPCVLVLDLSGDLGTGASATRGYPPLKGTKAGMAVRLAATAATWFQRQGEPVGLHVVGGEGVRWPDLPARTGRAHLRTVLLMLAAARPGGVADLSRTLARVGGRVRRRSLVVVISDGMEEPARWLPALRAFAERGTDLRFVHLFDRQEFRLDFPESALFYSPEGGEDLELDPPGAKEAFGEVVQAYLHEVRAGVIRVGGQYVAAPTDVSIERVLRRLVQGGSSQVEAP